MKVYSVLIGGIISLSLLPGCAYIAGINTDRCSQPPPAAKGAKGQATNIPAANAPSNINPAPAPASEAYKAVTPISQ